ncbi:MAG: TIGR03915 family putative DNA repair protein [Firmicutes bacterium]|nr:TIGR03915 family putative DNA repair protein [Bacillota bacterium]
MTVYRCEDSLESIFTAIYLSYEENRDAKDTYLALDDDPMLFAEDVRIQPDPARAVKVMRTLERRFGEEDYLRVCEALASTDREKAQAVYRTVVKGLDERCARGHLFDDLADCYVMQTFSMARKADREINHLREFLRFQELENGILYARIGPKCNALTFLMPHFADRLPIENFVIYDSTRELFGIHPARQQWYLLSGEEAEPRLRYSEEEMRYQELFRHFCRTISIKERENLKLQRNLLPLRFREYMIEF